MLTRTFVKPPLFHGRLLEAMNTDAVIPVRANLYAGLRSCLDTQNLMQADRRIDVLGLEEAAREAAIDIRQRNAGVQINSLDRSIVDQE